MAARVGVVIPTLDSGWSVAETLLSVLAQRDVEIALLVVDSGSSDATLPTCEKLGVKSRYVPPGNMYRAINVGLKEIDSDWVAYLNSDDTLYSDSMVKLVERAIRNGSDLCYGGCDYTDEQGRFIYSHSPPPPTLMRAAFRLGQGLISQPATIYSRKLYEGLGGFDEAFRFCADFDFFVRAFEMCGVTRLGGPPVARFRCHPYQFSMTHREPMWKETQAIVKKNGLRPHAGDSLRLNLWKTGNICQYIVRWARRRQFSSE